MLVFSAVPFLFAVVAFMLAGCGGGGEKQVTTGLTGSIVGRIVSTKTRGRVMAVAIMGASQITPVTSIEGGRFRIDNVPVGEQTVCVRSSEGNRGAVFVAQVLPNKVTDVGDVEEKPLGKISGFVYEVDEQGNKGKPIANALVSARPLSGEAEAQPLEEVPKGMFAMTRTDANGSYELLLPAGTYLVVADAPRYMPATDTVTVEELQVTECNFGLMRLKDATGSVYGKVTAEVNGQVLPVAGALVVLAPKGEPGVPEVAPSGITVGMLLRTLPNALSKKHGKQVVVPPAWGRIAVAFTDAEGNYTIDNVKPGSYRAVAFKEGYGEDEKEVQVKPGGSERVDFRLKAKVGVLFGYVRDSESKSPIEGATVIAIGFGDPWYVWGGWIEVPGKPHIFVKPVHGKKNIAPTPIIPIHPPVIPPFRPPVRASTTTDKDGYYSLTLSEGEYFVSVWKDGYEPQGAIVTVTAGGKTQQDFELTRSLGEQLVLELELPTEPVKFGEPVKMRLVLKNEGDKEVTLRFNSGQRYDFIVRSEDDEVVWQWSHDKAFAQVTGEEKIQPGGQLVYEETWAQVDNDGNQVKEGVYYVEGVVTCAPPISTVGSVTVGESPEVGGGIVGLHGGKLKRTKR
jgi:hypothetical protein